MLKAVSLDELSLNDKVDLTLYGAVNGRTELSGKLLARLNAQGLPTDSNAYTNHTNIYPKLPESLKAIYPDAWDGYNYLLIQLESGELYYIGEAWVVQDALYVNTVAQATVVIDGFRDPDTTTLKRLLLENGYTVRNISVSE